MFVLDIARLDAASAEVLEEPVGAPVFLMQGAVQDDTAQCLVAVSSHYGPANSAFRQISAVRSGLTEYLLARVRRGNEFQDAGRRQVLLVDPHAEG